MMSEIFSGFLFFQSIFCLICFLWVVPKQTVSKMENWSVISWQVVSEIFVPKMITIW